MTSQQTDPSPDGAADPSPAPEDWWRSAVFYQVYPRSFADADGDGVYELKTVFADKLVYVLVPDSLALAQLYETLPSPVLILSGKTV